MVERGADPSLVIQLAHELQRRVGLQPLVKVDSYSLLNESGIIYRILRVQPGSMSEISRTIRAARTMKMHIRCIGRGSSLNKSILMNDFSVVLDLRYLSDSERIERVQVQMKDMSYINGLRILAGVTVGEFCEYQTRNQMCVPTNVEQTEKTIVGAIMGASCGSITKAFGSLADYAIQVRIMDIHGEIRTYADTSLLEFDDAPNHMKNIISGLGMLGVVYDVVLRYDPLINVNVKYEFLSLESVLNDRNILEERIKTSLSTQLIYLPFNSVQYNCDTGSSDMEAWRHTQDEVIVRTFSETDIDSDVRHSINIIDEDRGCLETVTRSPNLIPLVMKESHRAMKRYFLRPHSQYLPWAIHCFPTLSSGVHEATITVPFTEDDAFYKTMRIVLDKIDFIAHECQNYSVNAGIRVNFTSGSEVTLNPARSPSRSDMAADKFAHIRLMSVLGSPGWQHLCFTVLDEVLRQVPQSTLQWASEWIDRPIVVDRILEKEGDQLEGLKKQIEIMDRDGVFLNYHLQRIFYPHLESYRATYKKLQDEFMYTLK